MQRLNRDNNRTERGAVAVVVALLMVPLLGFAAISIDVADMWADRQRLQTSADAAALAIAQDCAHGYDTCSNPGAADTATTMTNENFDAAGAQATVPTPVSPAAGQVRVVTTTESQHLFAPILGLADRSPVSAAATAKWGAPTGGPAVLPLTISICQFNGLTDGNVPSGDQAIVVPKSGDKGCGANTPGGFGWVTGDVDLAESDTGDDGDDCSYLSKIGDDLKSDTGKSNNGCLGTFDDHLAATNPTPVLLPIFDYTNGLTGANLEYHIYGYAAFVLAGYDFNGNKDAGTYALCKQYNPQNCIQGHFVKLIEPVDAFDYGVACTPEQDPATDGCAPNLGDMMYGLTG